MSRKDHINMYRSIQFEEIFLLENVDRQKDKHGHYKYIGRAPALGCGRVLPRC